MVKKHGLNVISLVLLIILLITVPVSLAVTTKITRHSNSADLLKGDNDNVIISSRGTITLGRSAEVLLDDFEGFTDVWSINTIVANAGSLYFGTSPNGGIYRYTVGRLTRIYPEETGSDQSNDAAAQEATVQEAAVADANDNDTEKPGENVEAADILTNEHIFAMAIDVSGRLLAGISGDKARLCRFELGGMVTIFESEECKYIFSIVVDAAGNTFFGTGPKGRVYRIDSASTTAQMIYETTDKNILSLAIGKDGYVYAGSDTRGVIYKIEPHGNKTTILYDSEQPEIAALLYSGQTSQNPALSADSDGNIYAAATLAELVRTQTQFASSVAEAASAGRPETRSDPNASTAGNGNGNGNGNGVRRLEIANTQDSAVGRSEQAASAARRATRPTTASYVYKIDKDGYVTAIFSENLILFCMAAQEDKVYLGTGNSGQVYLIEPELERQTVIYEDPESTQITAIINDGQDIYIGTANPARLIKLGAGYAKEGTYISGLIDAEQPAQWGKMQLDADIPVGCRIFAASRSGNVNDVNDPTFSAWTSLEEVTKPLQLLCPLGRFCQYKLVLRSDNGYRTPLIREIAVSSTIPNLAPKISAIEVSRLDAQNKQGVFKITATAEDDNEDELVYNIDFRKIGRTGWIKLKEENESNSYEWNSKTVEDGRYEIRVIADDYKSNSTTTKQTGSRISNPVIVDNSPAVIESQRTSTSTVNDKRTMIISISVRDELSVVSKLEYTIDSNEEWLATVPDDLVYDTTTEYFTIEIDYDRYLPRGEHVLSMKITDAAGNVAYKTMDIVVD